MFLGKCVSNLQFITNIVRCAMFDSVVLKVGVLKVGTVATMSGLLAVTSQSWLCDKNYIKNIYCYWSLTLCLTLSAEREEPIAA